MKVYEEIIRRQNLKTGNISLKGFRQIGIFQKVVKFFKIKFII